MDLLNHDIVHEFPEHREKIHALKTSNAHFAKLYEQYDELNHRIAKIEHGSEVMTDEALEEFKKERLQLKDQIYQLLLVD